MTPVHWETQDLFVLKKSSNEEIKIILPSIILPFRGRRNRRMIEGRIILKRGICAVFGYGRTNKTTDSAQALARTEMF